MKFFRTLTTLLIPRKAEFAKRLVSKRLACAKSQLFAGLATAGTDEYRLRTIGLESVEYSVSPEATIVNILELYWKPYIAQYHTNLFSFGGIYEEKCGASDKEKMALKRELVNRIAGYIEYDLTGKPDAASHLPEFNTFVEYMRYRITATHPKNVNLRLEDGFTDEFFSYAIEESRFVFKRG